MQNSGRAACAARVTPGRATPGRAGPPRRQAGAVAIMFAMLLLPLIGMLGMALDLARFYNRKAELQNAADAAALAAARELDGTAAGIERAVRRAQDAAASFHYEYNRTAVTLDSSAVTFHNSPGELSGWLGQADAGSGADLFFVKVDVGAALGAVGTPFLRVLSADLGGVTAAARAIAGRPGVKLTPLAVCALDPAATHTRHNVATDPAYDELVEFGFRRGVSYNLLAEDDKNFLVNPMPPLGPLDGVADISAGDAAPFVCGGGMLIAHVAGAQIRVQSPFPIAALVNHLNSRFDVYGTPGCAVSAAGTTPPDFNVKQFTPAVAAGWMNPAPTLQTAAPLLPSPSPPTLTTNADRESYAANAIIKADYGPLWVYSRPLRASPPNQRFELAEWPKLYPEISPAGKPPAVGPVATGAYPTIITGVPSDSPKMAPYMASGGANFTAPAATRPGLRERRVLSIPLLDCPVAGRVATVLGIGQFFMTVKANAGAKTISAEFAGAASEAAVAGAPELYPELYQ